MFEWLISFQVTEWLGMLGSYILAGAIAAAGVYLAGFATISEASPLAPFIRPLRYVGLGLVGLAIVLASAAYFKHIGATQCQAAWREKNLELQIVNLRRDIAAQKKATDAKITEWQNYTATLEGSLAAGRRATRDDDRRLCGLIGNAAAGCKAAR